MDTPRCFCGGPLYPGTTLITASNGSLMVECYRCNWCGHEEIDGSVAHAALAALRSGTLWRSASNHTA